jgi:hypothetical protein
MGLGGPDPLIEALLPVPNPNPAFVALRLSLPAHKVRLRLYSRAMTAVWEAELGPLAQGWHQARLPAGMAHAQGTYFLQAAVMNSDGKPASRATAKLMLLR